MTPLRHAFGLGAALLLAAFPAAAQELSGPPTWTPGLTIAAPANTLDQGVNITQFPAGAATSPVFDSLAVGSPGAPEAVAAGNSFVTGLVIEHYFGGATASGGREPFAVYGALEAPTSAANGNRNYAAINGIMEGNSGDGGGATTTLGAAYAASGTTALTVASIANFASGDTVELVLDSGQALESTVAGAPSGSTITINGTLPSAASIGEKLWDLTGSGKTTLTAAVAASGTTALTTAAWTGPRGPAIGDPVVLVMNGPLYYPSTIVSASGAALTINGQPGVAANIGNAVNDAGGSYQGGLFSFGDNTYAAAGTSAFLDVKGAEFDVSVRQGATTNYKGAVSIVNGGTDADQGLNYDCGLCVSAAGTSIATFRDGILFGPMNGNEPVGPNGTLIATSGAATVTNGIDFSSYNFTGNSFSAPFFSIGGAGHVIATGLQTASGAETDYLCLDSAGDVIADTAACLSSIAALKEHIRGLGFPSGLADVLALRPVDFRRKPSTCAKGQINCFAPQMGFVAENVAKVDRRAATFNANGSLRGYRPEAISAMLVGAVQGLQIQLVVLWALVIALVAAIIDLYRRNRALARRLGAAR